MFLAACGLGAVEVMIIWNKGSATLVDPVMFVIVIAALLFQRRSRESRVEDQAVSSWQNAANVRPIPRELQRAARGQVGAACAARPRSSARSSRCRSSWALRDTNLAAAVAIYAIVAISLVLLTGWAGEISLGQVAFVAIGAAAAERRERALAARSVRQLPVRGRGRRGGVGDHRAPRAAHPRPDARGHHARVRRRHAVVPLEPRPRASPASRSTTCPTTSSTASPVSRNGLRSATSTSRASAQFYFVCIAGLFLVLLAARGIAAFAERARPRRDPRERAQRAGVPPHARRAPS